MPDSRKPSKSLPRFLMLFMALLIALTVLVFITGAMRDPTRSLHGVLGSMVWATLAPHLLLLSLFACALGVIGFQRGRGALAKMMLILSVVATLGSAYITARITSSVYVAGGLVNPVAALLLSSMHAGGPDQSIVFHSVDDQALSVAIYQPKPTSLQAPVMVYIHGGGFMAGFNIETDADLRWFSAQGWLVFSVDYRLFTPDSPTWNKAPQDVACGLAWVGANAAAYGGDSSRLALLGDSAGGNLALNLAYMAAQGNNQSACGVVPVPAAVVVQYPAVDPLAIYEQGYPIPGFEPKMLVSGYIGGIPQELSDRARAVSSVTYLSDKAPPTLILAPEKDSIVPFSSVLRFAEQARLAGVDVELVVIPFSNHVYNQMASGSIGNQARLTITKRYLFEQGLWPKLLQHP